MNINTVDINNPVTDIDNFIGRDALTAKIYSRIGAGRPQSVSIVGDYKIGKTSLLNYLTDKEIQNQYLSNPAGYIFIFISISENNITSLEQFVDILADQISKKAKFPFDNSINYYDWFKKGAEVLTAHNRKIIIFLDDFNIITQNENFPLEFFSFLRSMANNFNVAYVTTSYHDLQKLCISKDVEESPFFNIFTNMTLRAITVDKVQDLILNQLPGISDEKAQLLLKYAGRFPYQLKLACHTLKKIESTDSENNFEDTFSNIFYNDIKNYFEALFNRLDYEYQKILKQFVASGKIPNQLNFLFSDLERRDYAFRNGDKTELYSPSFERFIAEKFNLNIKTRKSKVSIVNKILSFVISNARKVK
jgi:serine/threonine-protein kinase